VAEHGSADEPPANETETTNEPVAPSSPEPRRAPGLREALVVGGLTVVVVLLAAVITFLLPPAIGNVVFQTPLLIVILIVGTAAVLVRITRPGAGTR
jgi:uncharacterized membrane protein YbhN (UPF0104 family)